MRACSCGVCVFMREREREGGTIDRLSHHPSFSQFDCMVSLSWYGVIHRHSHEHTRTPRVELGPCTCGPRTRTYN